MPLPDDQETAAADYNTTAAQPAPDLSAGQLTAAPEPPPSWQDVKSDPAFQAQPPEKQLIVQDRWATAARAYGATLSDWKQTEKAFDEGVARQRDIYSKAAGGITPDQARVAAAQSLLDKAQEAGAQVPDVAAGKALLADHPDLAKAWEHRDIVNREGKMPWEPAVGENYFTSFGGRALARTSNLLNSAAEGVSKWVGAKDSAKFFKQQQDLVNAAYFKPQAGGAVHPLQDAMADATGTILATAPATLAAMMVPEAAIPAAVARLLPAAAAGTRWAAAAVHAGKFLVGSIPVATEFAASAYAEAHDAHLAEHPDDEKGATQVANTAAAKTVAMLPAYALGGLGATAVEKALLPAIMKPIQRGISHFLFHSAANVTASTVNHSIEESIKQGKPTFVPPTMEGAIQDVAFAVEPSLRAPHEQAIKNDMRAAAKDVVAGTNQQLMMFRQIVADPDAPAPMRELAQKNVDSIVSGANKFLTEIGEPPAPADPKETLLETADRLKAAGSTKTAEVIEEQAPNLPPTPETRPRLQQIHDRLTELDAQFGGEGMVEVPERKALLEEQELLMAARTPEQQEEAPVTAPKVASEVRPDGTGAHRLDIPANATPEDVAALKATVDKMDLPDEVRTAFNDTLAKAENKAAGVPEPKVAATGQEIYEPETPAEVAAVEAKLAKGGYINTQKITTGGKTTIITRPQATVDKAVAEAQAKVKAAAAPAPKKPEGPTPGTYDSVKLHGLSKDEQLSIDAVKAGTKPIVLGSTKQFRKRAKAAGLQIIERILPDGSKDHVAFKDPEAYEAFKAVDGLTGEDKWKAYGKAFGYTDAEITSFLERRKKLDAEKAAALPASPEGDSPGPEVSAQLDKLPFTHKVMAGEHAGKQVKKVLISPEGKVYNVDDTIGHPKYVVDTLGKEFPQYVLDKGGKLSPDVRKMMDDGWYWGSITKDAAGKYEFADSLGSYATKASTPETTHDSLFPNEETTPATVADHVANSGESTASAAEHIERFVQERGAALQQAGDVGEGTGEKVRGTESESAKSVQEDGLLDWAKKTGHELTLDDLRNVTAARLERGTEHQVWMGEDGKSVVKITDAGEYGHHEGALNYLRNIALGNRLFNMNIEVLGVIPTEKGPHIVTKHTFVKGTIPSATEIVAWMRREGFEPRAGGRTAEDYKVSELRGDDVDSWVRKSDGVELHDTGPDNFVKTPEGEIVPVDVLIEHTPEGKEARSQVHVDNIPVGLGKAQGEAIARRLGIEFAGVQKGITKDGITLPGHLSFHIPLEGGGKDNVTLNEGDTIATLKEKIVAADKRRRVAAEEAAKVTAAPVEAPAPVPEAPPVEEKAPEVTAKPVVKGELRKEIPAVPPKAEPEVETKGGAVEPAPVIKQAPLAKVVTGDTTPLPAAKAAAKAETAAEGKGSILAATAEGPQTAEQITAKVKETGVVPTLKEVQAMMLGRLPTYLDYQDKTANELWATLKREAAAQYPAETLPEGVKEVEAPEDKSGQTQATMGRHPVTGVHMPMVSEEVGKDARGLPITKLRAKFTNNPEVTAAQIDTGQRILIPEEMNRADINPAIEWAIDPDTGERYVVSSTTPLGTFSEADTGDRSKRLEAEPTYSQAQREKTAFDQAHQKVATEKLENLGESTAAELPVDKDLLAEDEARDKARKDYHEDTIEGVQNDGQELETSPIQTQAAQDELESLGMDPSKLATEDVEGVDRQYTAVRSPLAERLYQQDLVRSREAAEKLQKNKRKYLEQEAKNLGWSKQEVRMFTTHDLEAMLEAENQGDYNHRAVQVDAAENDGFVTPDGRFSENHSGATGMLFGGHPGNAKDLILTTPELRKEWEAYVRKNHGGDDTFVSGHVWESFLEDHGYLRVVMGRGEPDLLFTGRLTPQNKEALAFLKRSANSQGLNLVHERPGRPLEVLVGNKSEAVRLANNEPEGRREGESMSDALIRRREGRSGFSSNGPFFQPDYSATAARTSTNTRAKTSYNFSHLAEMGMLTAPKKGSKWRYALDPNALDNFLKFAKDQRLRVESPEIVQAVFEQLSKAVDSGKIDLELVNMPNANWAADHLSLPNGRSKIRVNISVDHEGGVSTSIIHELAHHLTVEKLRPGYTLNTVEHKAISNLHKLLDYTARKEFESQYGHAPTEEDLLNFQILQKVRRGQKDYTMSSKGEMIERHNRNYYGFHNIEEFVAEVASNPRFQRILSAMDPHSGVKSPKGVIRTLLDQIHDVLRKLFAGTEVKANSALSQALDSVLGLAQSETRPESIAAADANLARIMQPQEAATSSAASPPAATLPPNKSATGATTDGKIVDWLKKTSQRLFTAEGNLPKEVFNLWTDRQGNVNEQTREIKFATRDLYNAIQDHFKIAGARRLVNGLADVPKDFVEKMNDALGGKVPMSTLPPEIAAPLGVMRAHIDRLSQELIDRGLVTGDLELKVAKDLGSYMARSFKLFDDPKWAEKIPQAVRNKARAWILSELKKNNPNATSDDANRRMEAMLQDWKEQGDTRGSGGRLGSQDFSLFIKRKNLPVEILDLLGEHRDPVINYARSVTRMATLLGNNEFLRGVLKAGKDNFLYENGKEPPGFTSQIATEKNKTLGPLAGLRTSPEVAQAFKEFEKVSTIDNPLFRHYMKLTAAAKGAKTVGSLLTQVRNAEQFWFFGMNGHYNMKPLKEAILSTAADTGIGEGKIDADKWREFYKKMLRLQVVDQSARANELRDTLNEAILEDAGTSDFTTTGKRTIKSATKATFGAATRAYQISDDVGKVVGFMNETARQKAQHPEWTDDQAEQAAARRIKLTYPTYSMVPEAIKLFRRQPILGPFMTFSYEVFRTSYHNLKLTQEAVANAAAAKDPAVKKAYQKEAAQRLAGQMLVLGGASTAMSYISRSLVGMSAQQEDDARKFLPPWDADSTLMFTGNDKDGPSYLNLSYQNPYSYITDPVMSAVRSAHDEKGLVNKMIGSIGGFLTSLGAPFVNPSILSGSLVELYANKDAHGREIYNTAADGDTKMRQILGHLYEALEPGSLTRLRKRIIPAAKGETRMNQQLSLGRELTSEFTGFKQQQLNYRQQLGFKGRDFVRSIAEADAIFRATALREGNVSDEEVQEAYAESEGARFRMYKEMFAMNQASIRQGLTQSEITRLLKANGVPAKAMAMIRTGRYRPLKPTDFVKQTLRTRGRKLPALVSPHADDPLSE